MTIFSYFMMYVIRIQHAIFLESDLSTSKLTNLEQILVQQAVVVQQELAQVKSFCDHRIICIMNECHATHCSSFFLMRVGCVGHPAYIEDNLMHNINN